MDSLPRLGDPYWYARRVKKLMRLLGDRTSGGHRGARGFGSDLMNCRSGLLLPETGSDCPYLGGSSPGDSAEFSSRGHGGATPRR